MKKLISRTMGTTLALVLPLVAFAGAPAIPPMSVPEPSALALMAAGLGVAALLRYKNRK